MKKLFISEPVSGGLILSYRCSSTCRHCMYACSPEWDADWISRKDAEKTLTQLSGKIRPSPRGPDRVGVNHGLHLTGGEPFLNFTLLLRTTKMANEWGIPSTFAETNCYWCAEDGATKNKLEQLKDAGLHGILISVNPFILEYVPFERTERAVRIGAEVFGRNMMIYQEFFYHQFQELGTKGSLPFEGYLRDAGPRSLYHAELLGGLFEKYPAKHFFNESCKKELTRNWHVHIDNYGNYIPAYCGGISLGNAQELDSLRNGIDLSEHAVIDALTTQMSRLYELGNEFGYKESKEGYVSKCHLCVDIRKHLVQQTNEFKELTPSQFYSRLSTDPSPSREEGEGVASGNL
ncbi:MAG: radical SAM protein [bacterium]